MPELPEVETICRDLSKIVKGLTIQSMKVFDQRVIVSPHYKKFQKQLKDVEIVDIKRRGKALIFKLINDSFLVIQLGMTGQLIYAEEKISTKKSRDTKVVFQLSKSQCLNYNDQRMFGRITLCNNLNEMNFFRTLGPEPFDNTTNGRQLYNDAKKRTIPIKTLLLDQTYLAGVGNIYASEILFKAHVNPCRASNEINIREFESIYDSTVSVLQSAIDNRGTTLKDYRDASGEKGSFGSFVQVYGRNGVECYTCKEPIIKIKQSGRSTFSVSIVKRKVFKEFL